MSAGVFIIAEAGVNHNGSRDMAFRLVDAAVEAGADAVKFQTFKTENLVTKNAEKAAYQKRPDVKDETQFAMLKRLELSHETHYELVQYCDERCIEFISTAFDLESLDFLVTDLGMETLKIPSGEITNGPLLLAYSLTGKNLIVSTGMATLGEVRNALKVLAYGLVEGKNPSREAFHAAFLSEEGQLKLREKITLLHCTTEYPAPLEDINLKAMKTMHDAFKLRVGYSDHSEGIAIPAAATALGASIIEKHLTLDKTLPGPDHKASLDPDELKAMVNAIRAVEKAMGNGLKKPRPSEVRNRDIVRKSLVAVQTVKKGEVFTVENLAVKRPGVGRSPMDYWDLLGKASPSSYSADDLIT